MAAAFFLVKPKPTRPLPETIKFELYLLAEFSGRAFYSICYATNFTAAPRTRSKHFEAKHTVNSDGILGAVTNRGVPQESLGQL